MSYLNLKPAHTHDCECCVLVGNVIFSGEAQDIYVHEHEVPESDPTIIIRTGSDGPEYQSFPLAIAEQIGGLQWGMAVMCYDRYLTEK